MQRGLEADKKGTQIWRRRAGLYALLCILSLTGCGSFYVLDLFSEETTQAQENQTMQKADSEQGKIRVQEVPLPSEPEESAAVSEEFSFLDEKAFRYSYEYLSEAEKLWYDDMEQILGTMGTEMRLSKEGLEAGLDESSIDRIFQLVLNDHPELFYVEGYTYTRYMRMDQVVAMELSGIYTMDWEEVTERRQRITEAVEELLCGIAPDASEYDKVKYIYETIIRNTDYQLEAPDNQNIYSVFVHHRSVCQGYAKAAQYLMNQLGVVGTLVQGTVDTGEGHAWNLVRIDGDFYYMDTTWGDASYQLEDIQGDASSPDINYDYLCVTTEQLLRTHILGGQTPMPYCSAIGANYYVREGAYFTSYDREQFSQLCQRYRDEGRNEVTVKCADYQCYMDMQTALIDQQEIFDYMDMDSGMITYTHNEKQLSLSFWMTN